MRNVKKNKKCKNGKTMKKTGGNPRSYPQLRVLRYSPLHVCTSAHLHTSPRLHVCTSQRLHVHTPTRVPFCTSTLPLPHVHTFTPLLPLPRLLVYTSVGVHVGVRVSTHAINKKVLCVRLWKGTCFCRRVLLSFSSSFFLSSFFLLLSSFFLSSSLTPESCLKIRMFVGNSDVKGRRRGGEGEQGAPRREKW